MCLRCIHVAPAGMQMHNTWAGVGQTADAAALPRKPPAAYTHTHIAPLAAVKGEWAVVHQHSNLPCTRRVGHRHTLYMEVQGDVWWHHGRQVTEQSEADGRGVQGGWLRQGGYSDHLRQLQLHREVSDGDRIHHRAVRITKQGTLIWFTHNGR
jgi:hypothetical protein